MYAQKTMCKNIFSLLSNITFPTLSLFMADSFYRIHICGLLGGDIAEEHTDKHADEEGHVDTPSRHAARHAEGRDERARPYPDKDTYQSSRH